MEISLVTAVKSFCFMWFFASVTGVKTVFYFNHVPLFWSSAKQYGVLDFKIFGLLTRTGERYYLKDSK